MVYFVNTVCSAIHSW